MKINSAWVVITNKCNMDCKYCYQKNKGSEEMSLSVLSDTMSFLMQNSSDDLEVYLWGGEPLIRFDLVKFCVEKYPSIRFRIGTNGLLVTEDIVKFCNKHRDNLSIYLSHDGVEQLSNRGQHVPDIAFEIAKIKNNYVHIVSLDPSNLYYDVKALYLKGVRRFKVSMANGVTYTDDQIEEYRTQVKRLLSWMRQDFFKPSGDKDKIEFKVWEQILINHFKGNKDESLYDCNVGSSTIAIATDGSIYPCDWYYDMKIDRMGDIYTGIDENIRKKFIGLKCDYCLAETVSKIGESEEKKIINSYRSSTSFIASKLEKELVILEGSRAPEMRMI